MVAPEWPPTMVTRTSLRRRYRRVSPVRDDIEGGGTEDAGGVVDISLLEDSGDDGDGGIDGVGDDEDLGLGGDAGDGGGEVVTGHIRGAYGINTA